MKVLNEIAGLPPIGLPLIPFCSQVPLHSSLSLSWLIKSLVLVILLQLSLLSTEPGKVPRVELTRLSPKWNIIQYKIHTRTHLHTHTTLSHAWGWPKAKVSHYLGVFVDKSCGNRCAPFGFRSAFAAVPIAVPTTGPDPAELRTHVPLTPLAVNESQTT